MTKRTLAVIALGVSLGGGVWAAEVPLPHLSGHDVVTLLDGTRIELTTKFRVELETNAAGATSALNTASVDLEITPAPGERSDAARGALPVHLHMEGTVKRDDRSICPCWMPAMLLLAVKAATTDDVERVLGFTPASLRIRGGEQLPDRLVTFRVLDLLFGQVKSLNPGRAPLVQRLIDSTLGTPPPAEPVCLPAPR